MREIRFRGREKCGDKWFEGDLSYLVCDGLRGYIFPPHGYDSPDRYEVDLETVGQYIGAKDINGNMIFEGDIVEVPGEDGYFLLKWDSDAARFYMGGNGIYLDFDNYWAYEIEVIGNIYDNPELMGGAT